MSTTRAPTRMTGRPPALHWHRPLLWLAGAMAVLAVFALVARFVDPREITGLNPWDKPLKFALSTLIYAVTWSWLIGQLDRGRRVARIVGDIIAITLVIELAIIAGAAATGVTSHFNVSTPLSTALWSAMAISITVLWLATFVVAALLFRNPLGDRARTLAIRSGAVISLIGLGLGFLMTSPTSAQLADFQGVAGAHTVGLADGGPGLPILGWSTVAGDLRIPHFVGMHALQAIPIVLMLLELASRRVGSLGDVAVRTRLVAIAAVGYLAAVILVTVQALRGQSIVRADAPTLTAAALIVLAVVVSAGVVVARARRHGADGTGGSPGGQGGTGQGGTGHRDTRESDGGRSEEGRSKEGRSDRGRSEEGRSDEGRSEAARRGTGLSNSDQRDVG